MHCGDCVQACPAGALASVGQIMTVEDASKTAARDKLFFKLSSGGVTVSGGEPLLQKNVVDLLRLLKEDAIHTAVDTALNMTWSRIMESMPYTDIYLADIKAVTPEVHDRYTGCNNGQILKNLRRLAESGKTIWIRTPLIPGANIGELPLIADFIRSLPLDHIWFELIPFHNYAYSKYKSLGMEYAFKDLQPPSGEEMNEYKKYFYGIKIVEYWK
jgi:pyruvate formate lyase activating enzyme